MILGIHVHSVHVYTLMAALQTALLAMVAQLLNVK